MGAGAQHFNIGQDGLSKISLCFPLMEEQNKIARLLSLIDERIATQNKIIDKLQSLIKGIAQNVARNNKPNIRLSECLECSSSTLQESDVCKNGTYLCMVQMASLAISIIITQRRKPSILLKMVQVLGPFLMLLENALQQGH